MATTNTQSKSTDAHGLDDGLIEYIQSEGVALLEDEQVRSRIISMAAAAMPLPNFIEKRILGLFYGAVVEAIKSASQ